METDRAPRRSYRTATETLADSSFFDPPSPVLAFLLPLFFDLPRSLLCGLIGRSRTVSSALAPRPCPLLSARPTCQIRAIGPNAGNLATPRYYPCNQVKPVPVFQVHGTDDRLVPYEGAIRSMEQYTTEFLNCTSGPVVRGAHTNAPRGRER